ncbi:hypothetical protein [Marinobacter sp. LV10R510-11A]|uniref:hypothetical protein n=1 Tax=Marinobacter sp. LV10R510-11A TaxID=1415568 RepID=UPI0015614D8F|nr:hypothetical protein [Marinobacter sp. LV10R510-11A]
MSRCSVGRLDPLPQATALALENGTAGANKLQELNTSYPYILQLADRWNFVLGENNRRRIK